jgi:hypothetical protein
LLGFCASAYGAEATEIASSFDDDNPFDFNFRLAYRYEIRNGAVKRELLGRNYHAVELVKELRFAESRHILDLRADIGLWKDLQLHLGLPIIVAWNRELSFAQNGSDSCGTPPETNCVTRNNSTIVRDQLLPAAGLAANQVVIAGKDVAQGSGLNLPTRAGLDQLHLGLSWAPLSQRRDPSKPTWIIGFEARIAVGDPMEYQPSLGSGATQNTSVGRGVHEFSFWTTVSRRFRYVDPWVTFFYLLPQASSSSLFEKTIFRASGQERAGPTHRGGAEVGLELVPWERKDKNYKVAIELRSRVEAVFEGRGYSPIWELLAGNPQLVGGCNPATTATTPSPEWNNGMYCQAAGDTIPYPGISRIESHLAVSGSVTFQMMFTKYFKASLGFGIGHEQSHFITFGDAGRATDLTKPIDPTKPTEVNPMYRPLIDLAGRRFKIDDMLSYDFYISAMALF